MTLTAPSTTVAPKDKGRLNVGISASDTTIYVAPIYKTVNGVKTKQGFDTTSGECEISSGGLDERISFDSASVNSTTKVTTLSGCVRGLSVTSTTASFGAGTGRIWAKGASIKVIDSASYNQSMALKNAVNAFTAANSFAGLVTSTAGINMSGTTSYLRVPQLTTAQRIALAGANGMIVYDTDLSVHYQYISGAWTTFATGTVSNAANNTGGKVDLATAAENAAGTATDATSGSPNVIPTSIVKATSTGAVNGTVPMLNSAVMLDGSIGGTGVASPVLGAILIGGGAGLAMTPIGPGTSGQVPVSNGTTLAMGTAGTGSKVVYTSGLSSSANTATSDTRFDTHTYTIPANDLVNGVGYMIEGAIIVSAISNNTVPSIWVGGTSLLSCQVTTASTTGSGLFRAFIYGTTTAGAASSVSGSMTYTYGLANNLCSAQTGSGNRATNGTLAIEIGHTFSSSGSCTLKNVTITRVSTIIA